MAEKKNKQISEEQLNRNYGRAYTLIRPLFRFLFPFRRVTLNVSQTTPC